MLRSLPLFVLLTIPLVHAEDSAKKPEAEPITVGADDWPWWRGPTQGGIAAANQDPPLTWSQKENVIWKSPVPGRGHGSPIVVGDRVFLCVAGPESESQSVLCLDRKTGKERWRTLVHKGNFVTAGINAKSTHASTTPACDGKRVYVSFPNSNAIITTALTLDGEKLWQTKVSDYILHQGYGSSPAIYKSLVLVNADNKGGGCAAGLDRTTGNIVWSQSRPKLPNYASPIVVKAEGKDQLVLTGCDLVASFDPLSGKKLWETKGSTTECVTSIVTDGKLVFTSGGYPKNHVSAVAADGSGTMVWEINTKVYVPSMLIRNGYLYAVMDDGFAVCWKAETGKEQWKSRLEGGGVTSSPVMVGDRIYVTNENGKSFVFKADPTAFELLAENKLADEAMSTPAICGGRIYIRVAEKRAGKREEFLYCIGKSG